MIINNPFSYAKQQTEDACWKRLWKNVNMSSDGGNVGMRTSTNPKSRGRNQTTKTHTINITIDDIKSQWKKQNGLCHWLGIELRLQELFVSRSPFAPSIDRIDSNIGYEKNNIVITSRFANLGKGSYDSVDFLEKLKYSFKESNSLT